MLDRREICLHVPSAPSLIYDCVAIVPLCGRSSFLIELQQDPLRHIRRSIEVSPEHASRGKLVHSPGVDGVVNLRDEFNLVTERVYSVKNLLFILD